MAEPVPSVPSAGARGPIGEARNPMLVIVLTIITCGIYGLYWLYKSFEELKQHNGEGLGGVVGLHPRPVLGQLLHPADGDPEDVRGRRPGGPRSAIYGLWLLLPSSGLSSTSSGCRARSTTTGCRRARRRFEA